MRHQKILGLALAGTLLVGAASCSIDSFLDVNTNPNNSITAPPSVLLTSSIITTGFANGNEINRISSLLVQHIAGVQNQATGYDVYNIRGGLDNQWQGELYAGVLENAQTLIGTAGQTSSPSYAGIAKLIKAYNFAMTTDLWGDIPYSEALQGLSKLQPRFDKQEDIYKGNAALGIQSLDDLIKEGLADLDKPSTLNPSIVDDPVYGGANLANATPALTQAHLARWKRMGNTLRLKLANTISRKEPALARTIINEVITANSAFLVNSDDFEVPFGGTVGNRNPIFDFNNIQRDTDQILSQRLLDSLIARNDPRLAVFFTRTPTPVVGGPAGTAQVNVTGTLTPQGTFTGFQNGGVGTAPIPGLLTNRSKYNVYLTGNNGEAPIRLLTNYQRLFILAESALVLGTGGGTPQDLYQAAIRASMTKAGVADAAVTTYFTANPRVALLSTNQNVALNQIMTQKWIASIGNGYEAYNDYRRTGFPRLALTLNAAGDNPNILPKRFIYPASELSGNAGNAPAPSAVPNTTVPVWWDID